MKTLILITTFYAQLAFAAPHKVIDFLAPNANPPLVVLEGGLDRFYVEGMVFRTSRILQGSEKLSQHEIQTGLLKAVKVTEKQTIAAVVEDGTDMSRTSFSKFPGVMVGDMVNTVEPGLNPNLFLAPNYEISYRKIFEDPNALPSSFELSEKGKAELAESLKPFMKAHMNRIMVQGLTDTHGSSQQNQIESHQRAITVRQFMIEELGFDEERVVALGLGALEQKDDKLTPDTKMENRRIVIKVVSGK